MLRKLQDADSLPDDDLYMDDEGEGETTLQEESTLVDDPTLNPLSEQTALNTDRSAPPTRQKDGQPLEPLHEVCFALHLYSCSDVL